MKKYYIIVLIAPVLAVMALFLGYKTGCWVLLTILVIQAIALLKWGSTYEEKYYKKGSNHEKETI